MEKDRDYAYRKWLMRVGSGLMVMYIGGCSIFYTKSCLETDHAPKQQHATHYVDPYAAGGQGAASALQGQEKAAMDKASDMTPVIGSLLLGLAAVGGVGAVQRKRGGEQLPDVSGITPTHDMIGLDMYTIERYANITEPHVDEMCHVEAKVLTETMPKPKF